MKTALKKAFACVLFVTSYSAFALDTTALRLREVDGGADYYGRFSRGLPTDPSYFPIGVWFESVTEPGNVVMDKDAGLNLYVVLTANSNLQLLASNGMKAILQSNEWLSQAGAAGSQAIAGWLLGDEIDMTKGEVDGRNWLAARKAELPVGDGRLVYNNYGKGVTFWQTDKNAALFVNAYQDVVSADNYWFTDKDLMQASQGGKLVGLGRALSPAETHIACNYGKTVDRLRSLLSPAKSKPVWGYVEVGHASGPSDWPDILPEQVVAAVWSCIIHGARGIVYFNHTFAGAKGITQHALREPPWALTRAAVKAVNARIKALAPVLNAPFVEDLVITSGGVDVMAKWYGGNLYLFAQSTQTAKHSVRFNVSSAGSATATVLDENRRISLRGGSFVDSFADSNTVHIYRIENMSP